MLWRIMWSNFECILHNACAFKKIPKHILQCMFYFYIFSLQYTDRCIWSIINDCTTAFTLLFCWKITVIEKCVLCELFWNIGIDSTVAYINTIINSHEDSQGTHFSLSMFNTGATVITDDKHSHFSNYFISVPFNLLYIHFLHN